MQKVVGIVAGLVAVAIACITMWSLVRFDRANSSRGWSWVTKLLETLAVAITGLICGMNAPQLGAWIAFLSMVFISVGLSVIYRFRQHRVEPYQRSILVLWILWVVGAGLGFNGNVYTGTLIATFFMWAISTYLGRLIISFGATVTRPSEP